MSGHAPAATAERQPGFDERWLILGVTTIGSFLSLFSQTTVNIGLAKILTTFNVDIQEGQWVLTSYMIALSVVIPVSGFLAEKVGMKRLYIITLALFVVGSILCSLAWSLPSLIAFRVLQGLGGGMLQPLGMAIVYSVLTPLERPRFMAILGLPTLCAPLLGPSLGGYLVEYVSWRGLFTINVPIGIAGLVLAVLLLHETTLRRSARLDLPGFVLSSIAFPAMLLGFTFGSRDGWGALSAELFLTLGFVTLGAWIAVELAQNDPMLDLRLFANPVFSLCVVLNFVIQLALFGTQLLLPLFLQSAQGLGALEAGLLLMPQGFSSFVSMLIAGRLYNRLGPRPLVLFGMGLMAITTWQLSHLSVGTPYATITWLAMARGFAMGFCFMPVQTAAYNTVPQPKMARATALSNGLMRIFGSFSTAFLSTVLHARSVFHYQVLAATATSDRPSVQALSTVLQPELMAAGITSPDAQQRILTGLVNNYTTQSGLIMAFDDAFLLLTVVSLIALPLALFLRDPVLEATGSRQRAPVLASSTPS